MNRALLGLALIPLCAAIHDFAHARQWRVDSSTGENIDRIGAVAATASDGDTIIVGAGTYYEHIPLLNKGLSLFSVDGPDVTILDGSRAFGGRQGSIIYSVNRTARVLRIRGFTLRGGTGSVSYMMRELSGGAILWEGSGSSRGQCDVSDCIFIDNATDGVSGWSGWGGGIYLEGTARSTVERCFFARNKSGMGGAIALDAMIGPYEVRNCRFLIEEPGGNARGEVIFAEGPGDLRFEFNEIVGRTYGYGYAVSIGVSDCRFVGNRCMAENSTPAAWLYFTTGTVVEPPFQKLEFSDNVVIGGAPGWSGDLLIDIPLGDVVCDGNTIMHTQVRIGTGRRTPLSLARNLFLNATIMFYTSGGGRAECNVSWPLDTDYAASGLTVGENMHADPFLCEGDGFVYTVAGHSPCASGNSPGGCGQIGAGEVGCGAIRTRSLSWGAIRALYR